MKNLLRRHLGAGLAACALLAAHQAQAQPIILTGPITNEVVLRATNEYLMTNYVYVLEGAVLRIEPGTVIRGRSGEAPNFGSLFITQGAKIFAEGAPHAPIIFTAEDDDLNDPSDLGPTDRGLWGGLAIFGRARLNAAVDAAGDAATPRYEVYEGLEDLVINGQHVHRYGGADDDDSSGVLRYVSLRHGGQKLSPDKEINGLSLGGVGRGTTIEYVEALSFADDGFEFFGGSVNTRYLVSAFNDDDQFDTDMGYSGKNQFWFAIMSSDRRDHGGELNGEPNERNDGTRLPRSNFQVYNATLIGAGANDIGSANNNAFVVRRYSRTEWYNSVFTDFHGAPFNGGGPITGAQPVFQENLWWGFTTPVFTDELFTVAANNNRTDVNPMLRGISRTPESGGLDPRPLPGSPALSQGKVPSDPFYVQVPYKGAFGPDDNWLRGWTALDAMGIIPQKNPTPVILTGPITGEVTLVATNEYLMTNYVYVLEGAVLRIEPGTVIRGRSGEAPNFGSLFITQGAKIFAEGAPHAPIIFTAEDDDLNDPSDLGPTDRGLWGGLAIFGRARLNAAVDAAGDAATPRYEVYEGLEDLVINGQHVHRYGGADDDDSSGVLRYVSLRHGGQKLSPDKEINGLSLGGVGRGTTIEYVEALSFADDGFEFFGGSVNTRYLVSAFNDDDQFDTDMGYSGKNQFWFAIMSNDRRDHGAELNGEPNERNDGTRLPRSNFQVYNATLIGAGAGGTGSANNNAFVVRRYSRTEWYNSVFTDFHGAPFNGGGPITGAQPVFQENLWWGFTTPVFTNELFTVAANNNRTDADPMLRGISRTPESGGLDPRPLPGSPALSQGKIPSDPYFVANSYKGAFNEVNWASDWTGLSAMGILTTAGGGNPLPVPPAPPTTPIVIAITAGATDLTLTWTGGTAPFTVERKGSLSDPAWTTVTTVNERTATVPVTGEAGFIRVGGQ